jgi:hypothetical protein
LTVLPAATVTLFVPCHAPPFTSRYGVMVVGAIVMVKVSALLTPAALVKVAV